MEATRFQRKHRTGDEFIRAKKYEAHPARLIDSIREADLTSCRMNVTMAFTKTGDDCPPLQKLCAGGLFLLSQHDFRPGHKGEEIMKRWLTHGVIAGYLSVIVLGVLAHAVQYREHDHPAMYFVVWDMFCGWSAWEQRLHIIAEGESGEFYNLAPGPWGEYRPFGEIARHHYDPFVNHSGRLAINTLRQTKHEPIPRLYVFEESWAKKHNLPPHLKQKLTPVPDEKRSYFSLKNIYAVDGSVLSQNPSWVAKQQQKSLQNNPRLQLQIQSSQPAYLLDREVAVSSAFNPVALQGAWK